MYLIKIEFAKGVSTLGKRRRDQNIELERVDLEVWEEIWAVLETPFGEQRAAYRRLRGGCHAPVLSCPVEPSFASLAEQGFSAPEGAGLAKRAVPLRISKTFLEVSSTPELVKRSKSMPPCTSRKWL